MENAPIWTWLKAPTNTSRHEIGIQIQLFQPGVGAFSMIVKSSFEALVFIIRQPNI